jgi:serine/threonine protein kinase
LAGAASPKMQSFALEEESSDIQFEGIMLRKLTDVKLKKYYYVLLGKELYIYKKKEDTKHKSMQNLVGVFLKEEQAMEEHLDENTTIYPFTLVYPGNKDRTYYLTDKAEYKQWVEVIKRVIGYSSLNDYYEVKGSLGKGKFGLVKLAVHKKTKKNVAIKILNKAEMASEDFECQRREIEVLKMC